MINKKDEIEVLNHWDFPKYLPSKDGFGYKIEGQVDGVAGFEPVTFMDIKSINMASEAFRNGTLEFEEDRQEEVYKELKIDINNNNYFTRTMIEDIILDPTDEKIAKIVKITSLDTMENFRRMLVKLTNDNEYDISNRVRDYIDAREIELKKGITKSQLPIPKSKVYKPAKEEIIETAVVEEKSDISEETKTKTRSNKSTTK